MALTFISHGQGIESKEKMQKLPRHFSLDEDRHFNSRNLPRSDSSDNITHSGQKNKLPPPPPYHQHMNDLPAVHGEKVQQKHLQSPTDCEKKLPLAKLNSNKGNLVERIENSHNLERVHKVGKPQR